MAVAMRMMDVLGFWHHVDSSIDALKMETVCFSKMLASTNKSTWCQNPEEDQVSSVLPVLCKL
jgi:hypothetical protein